VYSSQLTVKTASARFLDLFLPLAEGTDFLKAPAQILLTAYDSFYARKQRRRSVRLKHITRSSNAVRGSHYIRIWTGTQEKYLGSWNEFPNFSRRFDSTQFWQADIHQDQVRLKLFRFLNCFHPICRKPNNSEIGLFTQLCVDLALPWAEIIHHQNADHRRLQFLLPPHFKLPGVTLMPPKLSACT
jgi:hypothetical protein